MMSGKAKLAGVMGWPVGHSRSPRLHGYWLERYCIDGAYVPLSVRPERLEQALKALAVLGFSGCNLTIPHKELALSIIDEVDPIARRVGSVNTVIVSEQGQLIGKNTDVFGFEQNLMSNGFTVPESNKIATVLGAGGAARAVIVALQDMGFQTIRLVNRSPERANRCAQALENDSCSMVVVPWQERSKALENSALLVNTTSLGMIGQPELELDLQAFPQESWVNDIVYVPLETDLLARAKARGHRVVDGLGMLLHQARPCFSAWFGMEPEVTADLREAVLALPDQR